LMKRQVMINVQRVNGTKWQATFPDFQGALASGRSIHQVRRNVRKVLRLFGVNLPGAAIVEHLELPTDLEEAIARARHERQEAETRAVAVRQNLGQVVRRLHRFGLGVRDTGSLLGISAPYVHVLRQVRRGRPKAPNRPGRPANRT